MRYGTGRLNLCIIINNYYYYYYYAELGIVYFKTGASLIVCDRTMIKSIIYPI